VDRSGAGDVHDSARAEQNDERDHAPKHDKIRTVPAAPRLSAVLAKLPRRDVWAISEADGSLVAYDRMIAVVFGGSWQSLTVTKRDRG
jgi:hypothetical protein